MPLQYLIISKIEHRRIRAYCFKLILEGEPFKNFTDWCYYNEKASRPPSTADRINNSIHKKARADPMKTEQTLIYLFLQYNRGNDGHNSTPRGSRYANVAIRVIKVQPDVTMLREG